MNTLTPEDGSQEGRDGAPPASQDRATDASHGAASASPPSGSVSTGARFTPGPWEVRPHEFDDWGFVRGPADEGRNVRPLVAMARAGRFVTDEEENEHRRNGTDPYEANASLIAAAPDLYEALGEYMSQFGQALEANGIPYGPAQIAADDKARAALAKAGQ